MSPEESEKYLKMLGAELQKRQVSGEILLADDEVLLLDIKQPESYEDTEARIAYLRGDGPAVERRRDMDAYFGRNGAVLREEIASLANKEGLPDSWLDVVLEALFYLQPSQIQWIEYSGLRVYCSSADYLFTMKIVTGYQDEVGIRKLIEKLHIVDAQAVLAIITKYIPEQLLTPEIYLFIERLF